MTQELITALKRGQKMDAEYINDIKPDAMRYRFLRDTFAKNAASDEAAFADLAHLTGKEFDAAIDAAMDEAEAV